MQKLINIHIACWLFVCVVHLSDAESPYWTEYRPYDYVDHRPYPVQRYTDQYRGPIVPRPPVQQLVKSYEVQQYRNPWSHNYAPQQENIEQTLPREYFIKNDEKPVEPYYEPSSASSNNDKFAYQELDGNATDGFWKDPKMIEKVHMLEEFLSEDSKNDLDGNTIDSMGDISEETKRVVRQVRKERPGFFWTLARVTFETFNETRSAIKQISNIIGNNIQPDTATSGSLTAIASTTAPSTQGNGTAGATTVAPPTTTDETEYVLTRGGLQSLIRRNVLGLVRLFNIEWRDALNQSELNARNFRKELGKQVDSYLQENPNNY